MRPVKVSDSVRVDRKRVDPAAFVGCVEARLECQEEVVAAALELAEGDVIGLAAEEPDRIGRGGVEGTYQTSLRFAGSPTEICRPRNGDLPKPCASVGFHLDVHHLVDSVIQLAEPDCNDRCFLDGKPASVGDL